MGRLVHQFLFESNLFTSIKFSFSMTNGQHAAPSSGSGIRLREAGGREQAGPKSAYSGKLIPNA
jgi:hypothetical protein